MWTTDWRGHVRLFPCGLVILPRIENGLGSFAAVGSGESRPPISPKKCTLTRVFLCGKEIEEGAPSAALREYSAPSFSGTFCDWPVTSDRVDMDVFNELLVWAEQAMGRFLAQPIWILLCEIAMVVTPFVKPVSRTAAWLRKRKAANIATSLKRKTHVVSFTDSEIGEAVQRYIEPHTSNVDPADEDDIRNFAFVRESIFAVIERALASNEKIHLLVLADSGMGKTTLLLNFFARELRKPERRRREMALVPLGRADAEEQIKAVTEKRSTILLLDALDEDTRAIENHTARLQKLMELAADFRAVVVTCRTQFFASEGDIPTGTGVARVGPKRAGASGTHHFQRVYLLPFSPVQVDSYIKKFIPWYRFDRRRRARDLVGRIPELTVRPMLLGLLPDLLQREEEFQEIWDLYNFMVQSWLERESQWIEPRELLDISKKVAVDIYLGRQVRRSERLAIQDLAALLKKTSSSIETWKLTARSLLNRDAAGNYKFAHRSIMEFLFVVALTEGQDQCGSVQWTDMMCNLFLSWGRSAASGADGALDRARYLLEGDGLSRAGIFPLIGTYEQVTRIEAQWVRRALGQSAKARARAGIPSAWRKWTSRVVRRKAVIRLYEFSEGLVWQCVDMRTCSEPNIYRTVRKDAFYRGPDCEEWTRPTLAEFYSLIQVLIAHEEFPLYEHDLYWLKDEDAQSLAMVRLRDTVQEPDAATEFREGARLVAGDVANVGMKRALDVYAVPKIQPRVGGQRHYPVATTALQVMVWRGNAQQQWGADMDGAASHSSWSLTKEV
ncbi:MAG: hypothetical protein AB1832_04255 [Pseudomonadota bacterium]